MPIASFNPALPALAPRATLVAAQAPAAQPPAKPTPSGDQLTLSGVSRGSSETAIVNPLTGTLHVDQGGSEATIQTNVWTSGVSIQNGAGQTTKIERNALTGTAHVSGAETGTITPNFSGSTYTSNGQKTRIYPSLTGIHVDGPKGSSTVYKDLLGRVQVRGAALDPVVLAEASRQLDAQ